MRQTAYSFAAARIVGKRAGRKMWWASTRGRNACWDDSRDTAEVFSALPKSQLLGYRAAVDDLVKEAGRHPRQSDLPAAEGLIAKRLEQPEFAVVLSRLDGGTDMILARLIR